jgi:hypothetical protein
VRFPNVYGIDMPTKEELVAHQASVDGLEGLERVVATIVGADRVVYQNLHDLEQAIQEEAKVCARVGRASCGVPISCRSRADLARLHGSPPPPSRSRVPPPPQEAGVQFSSLESSCFNGSYVTESAVSVDYLATLARTRSIDRGGDANETHLLDQLEIPLKVQRVS